MFGHKKKSPSSTKKNGFIPSSASLQLNSLVNGTVIEGNINSDSDIRIDGTIKGTLNCTAKVIIGPSGYINGEIRCQNAVIEGRFEGQLEVKEKLHVRETAEIHGDVQTNILVVNAGAVFNVSCKMGMKKSNSNGHVENKRKAKAIVKSTKSSHHVREESGLQKEAG